MSESVSSQNKRIIDALRTVIDLPSRVTSLDLPIRMDDVPRVDVSFVAIPPSAEQRQAIQEFWDEFGNHANKYPYSQANDYLG